eukprot:scaffold4079_cov392-Prasinococcus_capsulatus_cf.AAC.10
MGRTDGRAVVCCGVLWCAVLCCAVVCWAAVRCAEAGGDEGQGAAGARRRAVARRPPAPPSGRNARARAPLPISAETTIARRMPSHALAHT